MCATDETGDIIAEADVRDPPNKPSPVQGHANTGATAQTRPGWTHFQTVLRRGRMAILGRRVRGELRRATHRKHTVPAADAL